MEENTRARTRVTLAAVVGPLMAGRLTAEVVNAPATLSKESYACLACHAKENPALYQQWGQSKHHRANVGCYECHRADPKDPDAFQHDDFWIATIVSPKDCGRCHPREVKEFSSSPGA